MLKLKQTLHSFLVQDCKRGERWLLFLGAILAIAARQSYEPKPQPESVLPEPTVEAASITPTLFSKSDSLLLVAKSLVGVPYRYAGKNPSGFDCSGFTRYVFDQVDVGIGASSRRQFQQGEPVGLTETQPGDLIFFRGGAKVSHVGIVTQVDDNKTYFIHASTSRGVVIDYLESDYFLERLVGIRRIIAV